MTGAAAAVPTAGAASGTGWHPARPFVGCRQARPGGPPSR